MSSVAAAFQAALSKGSVCSDSNEKLLGTLKKGDIIYLPNFPGYWHYCVFGNEQCVIQLTGYYSRNRCTCQEIKPDKETGNCTNCKKKIVYHVRKGNYRDVVGKKKAHKLEDNGRRPLDPDEIIKMAKSMIGLATYNIKYANCEHFATTCRYGIGFSTQMNTYGFNHKGTTWEDTNISTDANHNQMKTGTRFYRELSPTIETDSDKPMKMETAITDSLGDDSVVMRDPEQRMQRRGRRFNPIDAMIEFCLTEHGEFDAVNEAIFRGLKMGSIVVVSRPGYRHYGVYTGNENVIHLTGFNNWPDPCKCVKLEKNPDNEGYCNNCSLKLAYFVRKSTFWDFASKGPAQIVSDDGRKPLEVDEIIRNAKSMLGPAVYDKENANSEHFATMCRFGTGFSTQTKVYDIDYKGTSWEKIDKAKAANRI